MCRKKVKAKSDSATILTIGIDNFTLRRNNFKIQYSQFIRHKYTSTGCAYTTNARKSVCVKFKLELQFRTNPILTA